MIILLLEAAARALVLGLLTALLLWMLRIRNVPAQRTAWTVVLLAAVAMPLLMRVPWVPEILAWRPKVLQTAPATVPVVAAPLVKPTHHVVTSNIPPNSRGSMAPGKVAAEPSPASRATLPQFSWTALGFALYSVIAVALFVRLLVGLFSALRLWSQATPLPQFSEPQLPVRTSAAVNSPVTIGSGVLLPLECRTWTDEKLRVVLAHERAHVRHFDFHLQLLAGIYAAIFWFSPLGWWLRHRLSVLAEAISDDAGLTEASTRTDYAEIVLHFAALPRRPMTGVAMACSGNISERIEQLLDENSHRTAFLAGRKRGWIALLFLPCAIFVAGMVLRAPAARAAQIPQAHPGTSILLAQVNESTASPAQPAAPAKPSAAVNDAESAATPEQPVAPQAAESEHGNSYTYSDDDEDGQSFAIVDGSNTNINMSGNWRETRSEIDKARRMTNGKFLWFRRDGKSYVVTDPATITRLQALYKPIEELGRQQEELGKKQEALGRQQEELGRKQEMASLPAPDLSREIAALNEAVQKLQAQKGKEMTQEQLSEIQEKLGEMQSRIGDLQGKIGEKQGAFGEQQGKLGEEQGKLGEQQGRLGEQQGKLAQEANRQVKVVIDESLKNGKAQPLQ